MTTNTTPSVAVEPPVAAASGRISPWAPIAVTLCATSAWALLGAAVNDTPFPDTVEQFVWAHSFENAYWKHPPLPTWLLRSAVLGFGWWSGWGYVLAALCVGGTAFFTWRIARELIGERPAGWAVLLLGLHFAFSMRAQLYNHNTVLMLFSSVTVWVCLRARASGRSRDWCAAGLCAALAMLAKYQAVVLLAGIALALALEGAFRERVTRRGVALAAAVWLAIVVPHFAALAWGPKTPLGYAASQFSSTGLVESLRNVLSHFAVQLRFHAVMLCAVGLLAASAGQAVGASPTTWVMAPRARAWLIGLVAWPALFMAVAPPVAGLHLHSQWGFAALQFAPIWIAAEMVRRLPALSASRGLNVVIGLHALCMTGYAVSCLQPRVDGALQDRRYPSAQAAALVKRAWHQTASCPLRWISGPAFEGGAISLHLAGHPAVLEDGDPAKSPWIPLAEMHRDGFVELGAQPTPGTAVLPRRPGYPALAVVVHPGVSTGSSSCSSATAP